MFVLEKPLLSVDPGLSREPNFLEQVFRNRQNSSTSKEVESTVNYARINLPVARDCREADGKPRLNRVAPKGPGFPACSPPVTLLDFVLGRNRL